MKKRTGILVILLLLLAVLALGANSFLAPKTAAGEKRICVTVEHSNGTVSDFFHETREEYLRGAMEELGILEGVEDTYGLWVTAVDGETAAEGKQQWWGYTVNGADAAYGVDYQVISDGDTFVFTLHTGY